MSTDSVPELDITRYLEGMVRCGQITKVSATNKRVACTVSYPDRGFQTGYLNVLQRNTVGAQDFYVPEVGEAVWVLHPPRGQTKAIILGSCYTSANPPPYTSKTIRGILYADGSYLIHDTASGGNFQINSAGKCTITTSGDLLATVGGNLTATASGTAKLTAGSIELHGNTKVFGTFECTGTFTADVGGTTLAGHITNADGAGAGA